MYIRPPYERSWQTRGSKKVAYVVEYDDPTILVAGKPKRTREQFVSKRKAKDRRDELIALHGRPREEDIASRGLLRNATCEDAGESWLKVVEKIGRKSDHGPADPYTVERYRRQFELHVLPLMGSRIIADINTADAKNLMLEIATSSSISDGVKKRVFDTIKAIFKEAVGTYITASPFAELKISGNKGARRRAQEKARQLLGGAAADGKRLPTLEEARSLLKKVDELAAEEERVSAGKRHFWRGYRAQLYTTVFSGCRISELLGLAWPYVMATEIYIVQRADPKGRLGAPKNVTSVRQVNLPSFVCAILEAWRPHCPEGPHNLVFPNGVGNVANQSNIRDRCWLPLLDKCGLLVTQPSGQIVAPFGNHDWRHLRNSLMKALLPGEGGRITAAEHGWSSLQMSDGAYKHVLNDPEIARRRREVVDDIAALFLGKTGE
jgi:integrase